MFFIKKLKGLNRNSETATELGGAWIISMLFLKSVQSALSDLLTTSAMHGTFSRPSTKRGLI